MGLSYKSQPLSWETLPLRLEDKFEQSRYNSWISVKCRIGAAATNTISFKSKVFIHCADILETGESPMRVPISVSKPFSDIICAVCTMFTVHSVRKLLSSRHSKVLLSLHFKKPTSNQIDDIVGNTSPKIAFIEATFSIEKSNVNVTKIVKS